MSLVDKVDVEGWLSRGLDSAQRELAVKKSTAGNPVEAAALEAGSKALGSLAARPGFISALAAVGRSGAKDVLGQLKVGNRDAARRAYMANSATYEELLAQVKADADKAGRATAAREAAWQEIEDGLKEAGMVALRIAIPLLLAAL